MFRTVPLFIIRSYLLYTQQWCMSYRSEKLVCVVGLIIRNYKNNTKYESTQRDQIEVIKFA